MNSQDFLLKRIGELAVEYVRANDEYDRIVLDETAGRGGGGYLAPRLRAYTDAYNTLLAERVEVECLRGLAIRAWHSFRSGLTATGGCLDGLTDGDILELVRLSNVEAAKLRGHDSIAATIAGAERQLQIPKMPNEREDEPIE